jgi:hypothetical protein
MSFADVGLCNGYVNKKIVKSQKKNKHDTECVSVGNLTVIVFYRNVKMVVLYFGKNIGIYIKVINSG